MKKAILIGLILLAFVVGCGQQKITGEIILGQCSDTDNGNNIEEKGTVNEEFTDKCVAGLLIEYYCEDNKIVNQNHRCPNRCVDGACV